MSLLLSVDLLPVSVLEQGHTQLTCRQELYAFRQKGGGLSYKQESDLIRKKDLQILPCWQVRSCGAPSCLKEEQQHSVRTAFKDKGELVERLKNRDSSRPTQPRHVFVVSKTTVWV